MCGRFTYKLSWEDVVRLYRLTAPKVPPSNFEPNYNVAPTQIRPIVRPIAPGEAEGGRELAMAKWGLIPFFSKDGKAGYSTINARAETLVTSNLYKQPFAKRRCLIPTSGWYEWKHEGEHKQPYFIKPKGDDGFAFAGVWDCWKPKGEGAAVESFSIVTTAAAPAIAHLHDRMPRVLQPDEFAGWIEGDAEQAKSLLPVSQAEFEYWPVDKRVGNVRNNGPELIEPLSDR